MNKEETILNALAAKKVLFACLLFSQGTAWPTMSGDFSFAISAAISPSPLTVHAPRRQDQLEALVALLRHSFTRSSGVTKPGWSASPFLGPSGYSQQYFSLLFYFWVR